jgi:hypothetical protein
VKSEKGKRLSSSKMSLNADVGENCPRRKVKRGPNVEYPKKN